MPPFYLLYINKYKSVYEIYYMVEFFRKILDDIIIFIEEIILEEIEKSQSNPPNKNN